MRLLPPFLLRLAAALLLTASLAAAAEAEEIVSLAGLEVAVWAPQPARAAPAPLILFSHGFHGCARQSRFLMEAFAAAGYAVFAPNHRDATCDGGTSGVQVRPGEPFRRPTAWSDRVFRDREEDMRGLLAALKADPHWGPALDFSRIGLVGHSLGGYTVLGLDGAWTSWKMPGVKAVLALSPYSQPYIVAKTLGGLASPVMYQGGTLDIMISPSVRRPGGTYDLSPAPKYYVEFAGAGHLAWTNLRGTFHSEMAAYGVAFMDHYVKGMPATAVLTEQLTAVHELRYRSELGSRD